MTKEKGTGTEELPFNWERLDAILQFNSSCRLCAELMGVSEDTIQRRIKDKTGQTFKEYKDEKMGAIKLQLQQKAFKMALDGNVVMLIFTLKNACGWADKVENTHKVDEDTKKVFGLAYSIPAKPEST